MWRTLSSLVALALTAAATGCAAQNPPRDGVGIIVHIVDGDTVDIRIHGNNERIRLVGIDTPETKKPNSPIECFGPEASAHTERLLPIGTEIRIERDLVARDDYGRLLGYIFRVQDGLFINLEILANGYAQPLTIEPNSTHSETFAMAARSAEANNLGLWAACAG